MQFRELKAAVVNLLGAAAAGRYTVAGYQKRGVAAEEVRDDLRLVQVFYQGGKFPESAGSLAGPAAHDVTLRIEMAAGTGAKGDLSPLADPAATPAQLQAALASFQDASLLADGSFDELADIIYQILMNTRNIDLGRPVGYVANRWISGIDKQAPNARGEFVIVPGSIDLTCRIVEVFDGDAGAPADPTLGAVLTEIETNVPDSADADPAYAALRGGGI